MNIQFLLKSKDIEIFKQKAKKLKQEKKQFSYWSACWNYL